MARTLAPDPRGVPASALKLVGAELREMAGRPKRRLPGRPPRPEEDEE